MTAQAEPSISIPNSEISNAPAVMTVERLARKRVAECLAQHRPAKKKAGKRRTCIKCAKLTCSQRAPVADSQRLREKDRL